MKKTLQLINLRQLLLGILIILGTNSFLKAQTVYTQNESGIVSINAAYFNSTRSGVNDGNLDVDENVISETITVVAKGTETDVINDDYLLMPSVATYGGDASTMSDGTVDAATDAPAAFYTVNFTSTGTYKIYAHENIANGSFWVMCGGEHARFENWNNAGSWTYHSNLTSKSDKLLTVSTTGEQEFALVQRKMGEKIDKIFIVEESVSFDPAAYVASDDLYDLSIDAATVSGFDAATLTYDIMVSDGTTGVTVGAIAENNFASVVIKDNGTETGDGSIDLTSGSATATVEVMSEDGTATQTYTLNITVTSLGTDSSLSDLTLNGSTITGFDAATLTYDIMVSGGTTSVEIGATSNDGNAVVSGTGTIDLTTSGTGSLDVLVTAEDGVTESTYSVTVTVEAIYGYDIVYQENASGIVSINAAYFDHITPGVNHEFMTTQVKEDGVINDEYLLMPGESDYNPATTEAPTAYYTVNFTETGDYSVYTLSYSPSGSEKSFWFGLDNADIQWAEWANYGVWQWSMNDGTAYDGRDKLTVSSTGEQVFAIAPRQMNMKIDKIILVKDGVSFDGAAYVANADLTDLTIDETTISGFDAATLSYDIMVAEGTTGVVIGANAENNFASVVIKDNGTETGDGSIDLTSGSATATVEVTSEDGTATQTYTLNITVTSLSTDSSLSDLTLNGSTITGFDAATLTYDIMVSGGTTSVEIGATSNDGNAVVSGTGTIDLTTSGTGSLDVLVTAEDGVTESTYNVTVTVEEIYGYDIVYQENSSGIVSINAAYFDHITPGVNHEFMTTQVKEDGVINEEYLLMPGESDYNPATTEAPTAYYTVNFTETGDYSVYTLSYSPSGSEKSFWFGLDNADIQWAEWANYGVWQWSINDGTAYDGRDKLTVTTTGEQVFAIAPRQMNMKIDKIILVKDGVSFDGAAYVASANLFDLTVDETTVSSFDASTLTYDIVVPEGTTGVTVGAIAENNFASVVIKDNGTETGDGTIDLTSGSATATIEVTAEDGSTTETYTINLTVYVPSTDASLSDLAIDGTTITGFETGVTSYDVEMPYGTTSVVVSATQTDENASVVIKDNGTETVDGTIDLTSGSATATIEVTAEDGSTTETYTINLTVYVPSTDATLSDLAIDGTTITGFESGVTTYDVEMPYETTSVVVSATQTDENASIIIKDNGTETGDGTIDLTSGSATATVEVTAEDGSTTETYTINLTVYVPSTDATLSDLAIDGTTITGFETGVTTYDVEMLYETTSVVVSATQTDENASVVIKDNGTETGDGTIDLTSGSATATVEVTAEDGSTTETYTINLTVYVPSTDATLSDLAIDGTTITGFEIGVTSYDVELPVGTTSVEISAITNDPLASITSGTGVNDLNSGITTVYVLVTAEDGTTLGTYTINLTVAVATSIGEETIDNVVVYPNPAVDKLNITNINGATVSVYNMQGSLLINKKACSTELNIDISNLNSGMYILKIEREGQIKSLSFIKK